METKKAIKTETEAIYKISEEKAALHITKGNSKVGKEIYTFSTLPGNAEHMIRIKDGQLLTDIPGTCGKHCENCFNGGCYAVNSIKQHHNTVTEAWGENTLLLRSGKVFDEVEAYITKANKKYAKTKKPEDAVIKIFRINVSGEIQNAGELESWNKIAQNHPETQFGLYTKNYEALQEFLEKRGDTSDNFVINVSQWHGVADDFLKSYAGKINVFEYDDTQRKSCTLESGERIRLEALPHCPAVTPAGKHAKNAAGDTITCSMCKKCYRKTGTVTAVYAH